MATPAISAVGLTIALTAGPASASAANPNDNYYGCPPGAACIYNNGDPNSGIENGGVYWSYGPHNLNNQVGNHYVVNNQTSGAWVELCTGYNGTGNGNEIIYGSPDGDNIDLTPINSIVLGTGENYPCSPP
ncbi:hypothetical protein [Kitasatospora kifunensis]|uniref:Peptidase inhibitor family I36 n=1 Tax=Kitasatospora kifunensis TaxID=58351 RepID=A0A7W7QXA2_KITKI|nr:hypothetical protein [Kitasatospora kifunensis]MBB4921520.1 hypothetical protein [Kitasatospora kifunensis]